MNFYETVFIARQDLTNPQVEELATTFGNIIRTSGGEISKTEMCGARNLAYKIKKNKKGHYVLMNISCNPEDIKEMERQMRLNEDILRYLTLRVETLDPNPSKLMQRPQNEDRYRNTAGDQEFAPSERTYSDKPSRPRYQTAQTQNSGEQ